MFQTKQYCNIKYSQSSVISNAYTAIDPKENAAASNTVQIHQWQQKIRVRHTECRSNLQSHGENTWIFWSGVWRWKMLHLREIGSRHNSYINMILRQASFSILTAYFLGRQMSDVSMGVTGREWLTRFLFCRMLWGQEKPFCREDWDGERGYVKWWGEVFWLKEIFFRGESILKRGYERNEIGTVKRDITSWL